MAAKAVLKAIARPGAGKGAARAARRAGKVPAVIYGDKKPPVAISLDFAEVSKRLQAGHFLTTLLDVDLDGTKHQVIPRGFQLDPLKDTPTHFYQQLRLGRARELLQQTDMSITSICVACGFESPSHFSRTYRARFGASPRSDRQTCMGPA